MFAFVIMEMKTKFYSFVIAILVLLFKVENINCDTSSDDVSIRKPAETAIFELHQLISQESALRLTLDKQIQDLRVILYQLKAEQESIIPNVDIRIINMYTNITGSLQQKFLTVQNQNTDLASNFSSFQELMTRNLEAPSPIYFSATLVSTFTTTKSNDILVYNYVINNKGNGYNPSNGTFVCPRDGTYLIAYSVLNQRQNYLHARLKINGSDKIRAVARGDHTFISAERVSIHELRKGDQVNVIVSEKGSQVYGDRYSNFAATYIPG